MMETSIHASNHKENANKTCNKEDNVPISRGKYF